MTPRRFTHRLVLAFALLLLSALFATNAAAAIDDVCISWYGETTIQRGSARCDSDATSVAIARGEDSSATAYNNSRATVNGNASEAHASDGGGAVVNGDRSVASGTGQNNIATVNGVGSEAVAENGDNNIATVSGDNSDALAGNGDDNRATVSGDDSQASAQAAAGCDATVAVDHGADSCP